uniref:hypothetical protein n=1 Tax=Brachybacterium alimentarium TaxID=47845 RepID=UPI0011C0632B|nr:hypothetical protein [Brachybacterium alimentarium]
MHDAEFASVVGTYTKCSEDDEASNVTESLPDGTGVTESIAIIMTTTPARMGITSRPMPLAMMPRLPKMIRFRPRFLRGS